MTKQFILCALAVLSLFSCGQRNSKQFPSPAKADAIISVFGEDNAALDPVRLCDAVLTTEEGMESAFPDETDSFFEETTPEAEAFYFPAADIKDELLARTVQLRYNYVALFNRVIHSYEWFQRASTGIDDETTTKKDTLEWIRYARPKIPESVIRAALPDAGAQAQASKLLKAYNRFDGNDSAGSPFSVAVNRYTEALSGLPELVSKEETDRFEERFWNWYDKRNVVPEIDTLVRMNMYEYEGPKPSDGELENLKRAIEAEKDIDRRTVLALEYVKFSKWDGVPMLGEILESRIYTKYLLEAWISWRANAQMYHSPSSFGVIANNYYDKVRTICLDTMVRHCLESEDKNAECLIENLLFCEIIHRMGSIAGNSSFNDCAMLSYNMFIHPRLLENSEDSQNQ
jgi:hypothetical protein